MVRSVLEAECRGGAVGPRAVPTGGNDSRGDRFGTTGGDYDFLNSPHNPHVQL